MAHPPNRRKVQVSVYVVAAFIILFTLVYMFNMARNHMAPIIPTEVVRMGIIDTPETISAIIIRDERVYYAPRAGQLVFSVSEGERVRAGERIASIQDSTAVAGINADMIALDARAMLVSTLRYDQADPNITRINNHIRGQVDTRAHSFTALNFSDLYVLRDNLNQSIHNRNQLIISGSLHAGGDYARQQAELLARMGVHSTDMYARSGGIMTPIIDGLEEVFTISGMMNLTREQLNFTPDAFPLFPAQELEMNDAAFKIVGNVWYIAAYIPNEKIRGFAAQQMRNVYVESPVTGAFEPMQLRIQQINAGTRDSRVIFRNTRYVMDFMHQRNVNIRISQVVETGLKIPNTAVTERQYYIIPLPFLHGLIDHHILRYTGDGSVPIPVSVTEWAGATVHISSNALGLNMGDIILDGLGGRHTLSDMHTVQGIYWANHGYARFRPIYTDAPITDRGGTTLLCPMRNRTTLREFDSIVVDANMVSEGDLIW
ncbi:MAG: hypothetical protein FWC16_02645 [Defluviitaleaceae bacterium]|nr:hypothetical protein [Defluviitaleaceae bacterium]MCL2273798.1 hypothetical protein [Defluviitaleaceae bacterium]